jgi:hypothetical protein
MKLLQQKNVRSSGLFVALLVVAGAAVAGGGGGGMGGLQTATTTATSIRDGLFTFVGVCAAIYLIYLAAMAKADKKTWGDFGMGVVYVAIAGASIVLASWAWNLFQ